MTTKAKTFSYNSENGISNIGGRSESGLIKDGVFTTTTTYQGVSRTFTHTLTQVELDYFAQLPTILEGIVKDCFEIEKLKRIIYKNQVDAICIIFENDKYKLTREAELPETFEAKNPEGVMTEYNTAWLMGVFRGICEEIKPNFVKVEWYEPNTLQVDEIPKTQKEMTDECLFCIYLLGELFKQVGYEE